VTEPNRWAGARYVALGSSFAAGPGIPSRAPGSPRAAGRSTGNYAHRVARQLGLDLVDVTFSGATTQEFVTSVKRPAQVAAVTGSTRLVTVTGGGNDVGFAPRILFSSLPGPVQALPAIRRQLASFADPALTEERFTQLRENLRQLAAQVKDRAPRCRLVFVEYLTVLPPDDGTATGRLSAEVADWGRAVARRMGQITQEVAAEADALFVPAGAASAAHHAWSADPWTNQFQLRFHDGAAYHPKAAGMAAVADLITAALPPAPD
jgi:lysophospholipase L1-like esterase